MGSYSVDGVLVQESNLVCVGLRPSDPGLRAVPLGKYVLAERGMHPWMHTWLQHTVD